MDEDHNDDNCATLAGDDECTNRAMEEGDADDKENNATNQERTRITRQLEDMAMSSKNNMDETKT